MTQATHMVLLWGDERAWAARTPQEETVNGAAHERFRALAVERGHVLVASEELAAAPVGKVVRRRAAGAPPSVTDGPFGELTEVVGGFYLVATDEPEDLVALVADVLLEDAEIRPVVDHS
ncbi:hypothetical protein KIN34_03875 [Cellulomonas sp. DKR-3]|uniref:YCII-related domain-containing protein n=1 Tax=Cellulomonas fulva TaxID=2835530 RepID=A0ABS5TW94_9CELL|nr:YciI family protein [Cellulomonas fulva]MBT0993423.1 hypothetical protein [Cellulomonas fulva]